MISGENANTCLVKPARESRKQSHRKFTVSLEENPEKFYTYMWKRKVYAELFPVENRFLPEDMIQYSLGNDMAVSSVLYEMNEIPSARKFSTGV